MGNGSAKLPARQSFKQLPGQTKAGSIPLYRRYRPGRCYQAFSAYFLGGVVVVDDDDDDEREGLFLVRRLLLPVEPLFVRSVVFIWSVVVVVPLLIVPEPVVVPLFIVPVPVEPVPVEPVPVEPVPVVPTPVPIVDVPVVPVVPEFEVCGCD